MNNDEEIISEGISRRMSMNTSLSKAKIFDDSDDEDSNQSKKSGKVKKLKDKVKKSPYKMELSKKNIEYETDDAILARRQKQIDYGKNTVGYDNYRKLVPLNKRTKEHPKTPVKHFKYSRRGWDCLIKYWRQKLHHYDPDALNKKANDDEVLKDEEFPDEL